MGDFIGYCREELELIGAFDSERDFYGGMTGKSVMELCEVFDKQNHSGMSAGLVRQLFNTLVQWLPLSPILDEGWEDGQNGRCSALFKDEGGAYYLNAVVFREKSGSCFTGTIEYNGQKIGSIWYIRGFPFVPKTFYVDVKSCRFKDKDGKIPDENGGWWEHEILDPEQLKPVYEYYKEPK